MLQKLQQKSHTTKKKLLFAGVFAIVILVIPVWILGFSQSIEKSLRQKEESGENSKEREAVTDLLEMRRDVNARILELKTALASFKTEIATSPQTEEEQTPSATTTPSFVTRRFYPLPESSLKEPVAPLEETSLPDVRDSEN